VIDRLSGSINAHAHGVPPTAKLDAELSKAIAEATAKLIGASVLSFSCDEFEDENDESCQDCEHLRKINSFGTPDKRY
jgi:hypothetical protein